MTILQLSYLPLDFSQHVYLNGLELGRSFWTYDPVNNSITTVGVRIVAGDKLECRYAHDGQPFLFVPLTDAPAELQSWSYRFYLLGGHTWVHVDSIWRINFTGTTYLAGSWTYMSGAGRWGPDTPTTSVVATAGDLYTWSVDKDSFSGTSVFGSSPYIVQPEYTFHTFFTSSSVPTLGATFNLGATGTEQPVRHGAETPKRATWWPGRGGTFLGVNLT